jgi:hypothetical protein
LLEHLMRLALCDARALGGGGRIELGQGKVVFARLEE